MPDRSKTVTLLLTSARQIVLSEGFIRDAKVYSRIARDLEDHGAADALRAMAKAREGEVLAIRKVMAKLAIQLADMPTEAD